MSQGLALLNYKQRAFPFFFAVKAAVTIYEAVLIGHTFDPGIAKPERERLGRHS